MTKVTGPYSIRELLREAKKELRVRILICEKNEDFEGMKLLLIQYKEMMAQ